MFVGHGLAAFALVGLVAVRLRPRREALALAVLAGAFATVPDVDMVYALVGLLGVDGGAVAYASSFWGASTLVHRAVTHSLVVAPVAAAAAAAWLLVRRPSSTRARSLAGVAVLALTVLLVTVATLRSGAVGGVVMAVFALAALAVAEAAARYTRARPASLAAVALVGLASHPFGDLVTGHPPALFYPFEVTVVAHRVILSADPTLHLLGAFAVELAAIWAGLAVFARLTDRSLRRDVDLRAGLGVAYAASVLLIPAPTLELSYPFVFSVLAVGAVGATPRFRLPSSGSIPARFRSVLTGPRLRADGGRRGDAAAAAGGPTVAGLELPRPFQAVVTGLTAVTVAAAAYTVAYLAWL